MIGKGVKDDSDMITLNQMTGIVTLKMMKSMIVRTGTLKLKMMKTLMMKMIGGRI